MFIHSAVPDEPAKGGSGGGFERNGLIVSTTVTMDYTRGAVRRKDTMKLAIMLLCSGFAFGQNTSPPPPTASAAASVDVKPSPGCRGAFDVLSDTQGVDFGPYLQRILQDVRENWHRAIPESAKMDKGKVAIEFAITKDGKIPDMRLVATSNDVALDRAAWAGISASNPFPPLPTEFTGPYLALRFRFYYNPDKSDLTCVEVSISPPGELQVPVGGSKRVTAMVTGTKENAVEWSVSGSGCSGSACGKMADNLYLAPSVLPNPPLVTVTAVSKADPTASASVTVHIVQPPPH